MTSAVGIYFRSLKDCLTFLHCLHVGLTEDRLLEVVHRLRELLSSYYKDFNVGKVKSDLSKFLFNVDTFYGKLVVKKLKYGNPININSKPEEIADALLVCLPRFFSVMYYLWYDVHLNFERLGGGGWKDNFPGYDGWDFFGRNWGGDLQKYLTSTSTNEHHNNHELLPGGFQEGDIKYGYHDRSGFYRGRSMIADLRRILDKESTQWNLFRDVFSTTVLTTNAGAYTPNIANGLALVDSFCEIVENENSVLDLEKHEGLGKTHIHWTDLVNHCKTIRSQLGKLFTSGAFSFTGYRRDRSQLYTVGFARRAASWLRGNLDDVKKALDRITPYKGQNYLDIFMTCKEHFRMKYYQAELGSYFTENFFPYGFTFDGEYYRLPKDPHKTLSSDWNGVINVLRGENGLEKLKTLLTGLKYPEGYMHEVPVNGITPHGKTTDHEVTQTEDPNNAGIHRDAVSNKDKSDGSGHFNDTLKGVDGLKTEHDSITAPQDTLNSPTLSGVDANEAEISEKGNVNGNDEDADDVECSHKVPKMEDSEDDDCFRHSREMRPWNAGKH